MPTPIVILVRPQSQGNLGAVARSMANFGFTELRIVGTVPSQNTDHASGHQIAEADWALATPRGHEILKSLTVFEDLESALRDCHYVLGTSGKKDSYHGGYDRDQISSFDVFNETYFKNIDLNAEAKTCFIFGPEDDGLSAVEAGYCDKLIHIPTSETAPSMNLAMAAAIIFYSYSSGRIQYAQSKKISISQDPEQNTHEQKVPAGETERLIDYIFGSLEPTQFFKHPDTQATKARLRRILRSLSLNVGDLLFVFEIFYQLKCHATGHYEERSFLSSKKLTKT